MKKMRRSLVLALSLFPCLVGFHGPAVARNLTLADRIKAREAIERVYWKHRIWPGENRGNKPPLDAVLSPAQIRARVEDDLRKSNALEESWRRPITAGQQAARQDARKPEFARLVGCGACTHKR